MLLREQDTIKKKQADDENAAELDVGDNKNREYEVEVIWESIVYIRESESGHLPGFYYLVS